MAKASEKKKARMRERAKERYYSMTPEQKIVERERVRLGVRKWRAKYPEKLRAHKAIFVEVRAGRLKPVPCFCGELKVEAHHKDYTKPLEVIWYCKKHHRMADRGAI